MIEFVQATPELILEILPQESQSEPIALAVSREAILDGKIPLDLAVVGRDEEGVLGVGGAIEMWPGVARLWALFSKRLVETKKYKAPLARRVQRGVSQLWTSGTYHRIECTVLVSDEKGIEFLQWLGFEREAWMRRYTPSGEDSYLYAKVSDA